MAIARRWEMIFMIFSGVMIVYTLRVNMSVAAQKMRDDLDWTEGQKGLVLSAFYWGYALGQIPASRLCQIYGAKWIFGLSVLIPSILTLFVPLASRSSFGSALVIRCIIGFFESASFPCVYHFIPVWIPIADKTWMIPVVTSGMYLGTIVGFSMSGMLVESDITIGGKFYGGWPSVFYLFGMLGLVWFPYWALFAYETPESHPKITQEELLLINKGKNKKSLQDFEGSVESPLLKDEHLPASGASTLNSRSNSNNNNAHNILHVSSDLEGNDFMAVEPTEPSEEEQDRRDRVHSMISVEGNGFEIASRTPWKAFFTHPAALTLLINNWVFGWIGFTLLSEMPSYLTDILGFTIESAGFLSVFPYLVLFLSSLSFGKAFDYLQRERHWKVRTVRQWAQFLAIGGAALGLVICGFLPNRYAAYTFMIITQLFYGACICGLACAYSDLSPNYSPVLNSIGNTIGAIAGIAGPLIVAAFTEAYPGVWGWRLVFLLTAAMSVGALVLWHFYQTSDIVPELNTPADKEK